MSNIIIIHQEFGEEEAELAFLNPTKEMIEEITKELPSELTDNIKGKIASITAIKENSNTRLELGLKRKE